MLTDIIVFLAQLIVEGACSWWEGLGVGDEGGGGGEVPVHGWGGTSHAAK